MKSSRRKTTRRKSSYPKAVNVEIRKGLGVLRDELPLTLSQWADRYFYLSSESSSLTGNWVTLPDQKPIMDMIGNDDVEIVTLRKAARVGYTKMILAAIGYNATHKKRKQLIYQPTDSDAEDFTKEEIEPMVRDCPKVREAFVGDIGKRSKNNTLSKKVFRGAPLDIRGGKSSRNYRRMTKDIVYYDELDAFDPDIDHQGSATDLGDKRTTTSNFPKSVRGSSPALKEDSQIDQSLAEADLVFRFAVLCPKCGERQPLLWEFVRWENRDASTAHVECRECGYKMQYSQLGDLKETGRMETGAGEYIDEDGMIRNPSGDVIPFPRHVGFIHWAAYSNWLSWGRLVEEFLEAHAKLQAGDHRKMKTFVNTRLAESWAEERESLDEQEFLNRLENYSPAELPLEVKCLTAYADVQEDRIEAEVVGWGEDDESFGIEYRIFPGDTTKRRVYDAVSTFFDKTYYHEGGFEMRIAASGMDTGYMPSMVYAFCARRRLTFATRGYGDRSDRPIVGRPSKNNKQRHPVYPIGVHEAKTLIFNRLAVKEPGPGYCHFPDIPGYDDEFFKQLTAEELTPALFERGKEKPRRFVKKRKRNEALDIRVGNLAVKEIINPNLTKYTGVVRSAVKKEAVQRRTQITDDWLGGRRHG